MERLLELQNRAWDDTEAVVFLKQGLGALGPSESRYRFTLSHLVTGTYRKYSVDSDNKAWLPRDDSSPGKRVFLTDSEPGADGKLPVITLGELRDSIKVMDVLLRDGEVLTDTRNALSINSHPRDTVEHGKTSTGHLHPLESTYRLPRGFRRGASSIPRVG